MAHVQISLSGIKAAIFDMDGTMINNMDYHKRAWQEYLKRHGIELSEQEFKERISGQKNDKIVELVFGRDASAEEVKRHGDDKERLYRELYADDIAEIKGLSACLDSLHKRGIRTAIATTANFDNREFALDALKLRDKFEIILGEEHVKQGKPSPEIYLSTAEQLGLRPEECVAFEDSPPGVQAAHTAGMYVVGILSGHSKEELPGADETVADYTELVFE